jgi:hypothetical protein
VQRDDYSDIIEGWQAGRLTERDARRLMEQRGRDIQAAERSVTAHSHQQALQDAHQALDRGHKANYSDNEFAHLFPPGAPLSPDDDEDDPESETGPGGHFAPPQKQRVTDKQKRASAYEPYTDRELFESLYGRAPKPGELDD